MTSRTATGAAPRSGLVGLVSTIIRLFERLPADIIAILARVIIGLVFWRSGLTKIDGFAIADKTFFLFREEYKVPLIPPDIAAYMATFAELTCPILLWAGLATRFGATALLLMTLVIEVFVYPNAYMEHGLWAIALLFLMRHGAGTLSLDYLIRRQYMSQ